MCPCLYTLCCFFLGKRQYEVYMNLSVHPAPDTGIQRHIVLRPPEDNREMFHTMKLFQTKAINLGMTSALTRGECLSMSPGI